MCLLNCYNNLHCSWKAFHWVVRMCVHSATCEVVMLGDEAWCAVQRRRPGSSRRCSGGLRSGFCAGHSSSFTPHFEAFPLHWNEEASEGEMPQSVVYSATAYNRVLLVSWMSLGKTHIRMRCSGVHILLAIYSI